MSLIKGLKLIEQAYNERNWDKIRQGYELVSGEPLEYVMTGEDYTGEPTPILDDKPVVSRRKSNTKKLKIPTKIKKSDEKELSVINGIKIVEGQIDSSIGAGTVKVRGNTFNPDNYEYTDEAPWLKDKKVIKKSRKAFKLVNVTCDKCKESFEVHPDLVLGEGSNVCPGCLKKKK